VYPSGLKRRVVRWARPRVKREVSTAPETGPLAEGNTDPFHESGLSPKQEEVVLDERGDPGGQRAGGGTRRGGATAVAMIATVA
jgi:hypothetical protein